MTIFGLGTPELIFILVIFLLFFGKDKLPELARSLGKSFNELKAGFKDIETNIKDPVITDKKEETKKK